ncbi:MAG: hypothetical protein LBN95_12605 [Prevotellaceae bacterium]|jgi:cell division protein FtsI (penicillin-binding protein 3)|nr:hypothetical protein [Prevotellaceae bacterium]
MEKVKNRIEGWYIGIFIFFGVVIPLIVLLSIFFTKTKYNNVWQDIENTIVTNKEKVISEKGKIYWEKKTDEKEPVMKGFVKYEIGFDGNQLYEIVQRVKRKNDKQREKRNKYNVDLSDERFNVNDSINELSRQLCNYLGGTEKSYRDVISAAYQGKKYVKFRNKVDAIQLKEIENFCLCKKEGKYSSCLNASGNIEPSYPFNDLAHQTILGIEEKYKETLSKNNDITLTLDMDIQEIATNSLFDELKDKYSQGCVIVMETSTGKIKAVANLFKGETTYSERNDMAFKEARDFGSTFKIVSMMIALENGFVSTNDTINTSSSKYGVTDEGKFRWKKLSAVDVIVNSSNVGISNIVVPHYENRVDDFFDEVLKMKFFEKINILPNTANFIINRETGNSSKPRIDNLARITYGHSISAPPIYILRFYNAIANGGKMIEPYLVDNGKGITVINKQICSQATLDTIKYMLESVVSRKEGTAHSAQSDYVKIAGKTGTAEFTGKEGYKYNYASFCGYFPADAPKYTCIVAIVVPDRTYGGGPCGRVFKDIAEKINALEPIKLNELKVKN